MPKWIMFPEYEKARFINHIIYVLWNPHLKLSIEEKIKSKLDWKLEVQKNKYKKLSHLSVNIFDLGTSPPLISGIKTCEVKCDMCSRHIQHDHKDCEQKYCALQIEFVFVSNDMKFGLTAGYKNIRATATLSKIYLSGSVMLKLCDFVNLIPGFSRYTLSFLNYPNFDFSLSFKTGSLKINYIPKLSKIIEPLLKKSVWSNLIYPRSKSFKIKARKIEEMRTSGKLIKYGQLSSVTEGSLCLQIKEVIWDTPGPKEPDNAVPVMLERGNLYQDYMGYSWHCVVGVKGTRMVYKTEHIQSKYITRRLKWSERFTFKNLTLSDPSNIAISPFLDIDVRVLGKKWDELLGQSSINLRLLIERKGFNVNDYSVDVLKFSNSGELGFRKVGTMTLDITYLPPNSLRGKTKKFATVLPMVLTQSIKDQNFFIIKNNLRKSQPGTINPGPSLKKKENSKSRKMR